MSDNALANQFSHEEPLGSPASVWRPGRPVPNAGHDQEIETRVRRDERADHLHGRGRVHVAIEFTHDEQQRALEIGGQLD